MHRLILAAKKGDIVDHINGNKLDNRKENLRLVTPVQNARNRIKSSKNKSGYNGVYYDKISRHKTKKWIAQYSRDNKTHIIGRFRSFEEAVSARQKINEALAFTIRY